MIDNEIVSKKNIELYNKLYKEITFKDGRVILKRFDKEKNIWITLKFTNENDTETVKKIKFITKDVLLKNIHISA